MEYLLTIGCSDVHYWSSELINRNRNRNNCTTLLKYVDISVFCVSNNTHNTHTNIYMHAYIYIYVYIYKYISIYIYI